VTKEALRAVRGLTAQGHPARELINAVLGENGHLDDLNADSHGNPIGLVVAPSHLTGRIDRTERFRSEPLVEQEKRNEVRDRVHQVQRVYGLSSDYLHSRCSGLVPPPIELATWPAGVRAFEELAG